VFLVFDCILENKEVELRRSRLSLINFRGSPGMNGDITLGENELLSVSCPSSTRRLTGIVRDDDDAPCELRVTHTEVEPLSRKVHLLLNS